MNWWKCVVDGGPSGKPEVHFIKADTEEEARRRFEAMGYRVLAIELYPG